MAQTYTLMPPFFRGDTPLFIVPISLVSGQPVDLSDWTAWTTFTTDRKPATDANSFLHKEMSYSLGNDLNLFKDVAQTMPYTNYFYYQFTNEDTENIDPDITYYWDVQINKEPANRNNFTLTTGRFQPYIDYTRGLD